MDPARDQLLDRFVHELIVAVLDMGMHPPSSQVAQDGLRDAVRTLGALLAEDASPTLRIECTGGLLRAGGRDLVAASLQAAALLHLCARAGVTAVTFRAGLDAAELQRFLTALADTRAPLGLDRLMATEGVRNVTVTLDGRAGEPDAAPPNVRGYRDLTSFLHDNHVAAFRGDDLQVERAHGVVEQAIRQMQQEPSSLLTLAAYDDIDAFTVGHSVRVALLALHVARAAHASQGDLIAIGTAALLHDVGKSRVPQAILRKPGRLEAEEWQIMAQHPRLGAEILLEQKHLDPRAIGAAFCHHMAPTGRGYPTPALCFAPSEVSKLVRVCDVFEALTAVRPYKKALTPVQAYAIMFRNAPDFDPRWLRFFARTIGLFPLGTRVLLSTGVEACVIRHGNDPQRPWVRVTGGGEPEELEVGELREGKPIEVATILGTGADDSEASETLRRMHCGVQPIGA